MSKLQTLSQKVLATYQKSPDDFAQWMLKNHVRYRYEALKEVFVR